MQPAETRRPGSISAFRQRPCCRIASTDRILSKSNILHNSHKTKAFVQYVNEKLYQYLLTPQSYHIKKQSIIPATTDMVTNILATVNLFSFFKHS